MKRICKTAAFWTCGLSLAIIVLHMAGGDTKAVILIGMNPLLRLASHSGALRAAMNAGPIVPVHGALGPVPGISVFWYLGISAIRPAAGCDMVLVQKMCW